MTFRFRSVRVILTTVVATAGLFAWWRWEERALTSAEAKTTMDWLANLPPPRVAFHDATLGELAARLNAEIEAAGPDAPQVRFVALAKPPREFHRKVRVRSFSAAPKNRFDAKTDAEIEAPPPMREITGVFNDLPIPMLLRVVCFDAGYAACVRPHRIELFPGEGSGEALERHRYVLGSRLNLEMRSLGLGGALQRNDFTACEGVVASYDPDRNLLELLDTGRHHENLRNSLGLTPEPTMRERFRIALRKLFHQ